MRREWLTGIIRDIHVASRGTYGYRRVHAELTHGHGVLVSANLVNLLMHNAAIVGLPGPGRASRNSGVPTDDDLVNVDGNLKVDQKRQVKSGPPEQYWTGDYRGGLVRDSGFGSP